MSIADTIAWKWLAAILQRRGLTAPNKDALYLYDLSDEELDSLKRALIAAFRAQIDAESRVLGAALCFWVSHWFQQSYRGGQYGWKSALDEIGAALDQGPRTRLVEGGLSYLQRPIRRINGEHQYLATVIMEGGFPAHMIAGESHWLYHYIEAAVLATGQGQITLPAAIGHAEFYQNMVPPTLRATHFIQLVANLAFQIAHLRRLLSTAGIGAGAVEWLDRTDAEWRRRLPIRTSDAAARRLVEGLVHAAAREAVMPVECRRLLLRDGAGSWTFGIRLQVEGNLGDNELPPQVREALRSYNRARLLAAGEFARRGPGAVGVASRSNIDDRPAWEIRSLFGTRALELRSFPRGADVSLYFAAGAEILPEFVPSGGSRITSDLLVFGAESKDQDSALMLLGTGSVRDTREALFVAAASGSRVDPAVDAEVTELGSVDGLRLISLRGAAVIEIGGDRYRIQSQAESSEGVRLEAIGEKLSGLDSHVAVLRGVPDFIVHRGPLRSRGDGASLRVRPAGDRLGWSAYVASNLPFGPLDIGVFDREICLDRLKLVRLPQEAAVTLTIPRPGECRIEIANFGGATFELLGGHVDASLTVSSGGAIIDVRGDGARAHRLKVRARWKLSEAILEIPVFTREVAFYDANGEAFPIRKESSIPGLLGASVEAVGRAAVWIRLKSAGHRRSPSERMLDRSLPFSQMREEVERLFANSDDLDAEVTLEAIRLGQSVSTVCIRRFDLALEPDKHRDVVLARASFDALRTMGDPEVEVVGRPFMDFGGSDRRIESYSGERGRHWVVPDGEGPWFVYAKVDGLPRSRPLLITRSVDDNSQLDDMTRALLESIRHKREERILERLRAAADGVDSGTCDRLAAFVTSLDPALPLQSFDVLRLLPKAIGAAVQLASRCPEDVLHRVLELEARMPLSWCHSSPQSWSAALGSIREEYRVKLVAAGLDTRYADDQVSIRIENIAKRLPCLSVHLARVLKDLKIGTRTTGPQSLQQAFNLAGNEPAARGVMMSMLRQSVVQAIQRNDGRVWPRDFTFRTKAPRLPTMEIEMPTYAEPVLDAPCFSAQVALGQVSWSAGMEEIVRLARGFDPQYFEDAFLYSMVIGRS